MTGPPLAALVCLGHAALAEARDSRDPELRLRAEILASRIEIADEFSERSRSRRTQQQAPTNP